MQYMRHVLVVAKGDELRGSFGPPILGSVPLFVAAWLILGHCARGSKPDMFVLRFWGF